MRVCVYVCVQLLVCVSTKQYDRVSVCDLNRHQIAVSKQ